MFKFLLKLYMLPLYLRLWAIRLGLRIAGFVR